MLTFISLSLCVEYFYLDQSTTNLAFILCTGYLSMSGPTNGSVASTGGISDVQYYKVGDTNSKKCIVLIPDIWGWHGGRTRQLADHWATELNCLAIVPKIQPAFEGGTDDDGLPPNFDMKTRGGDFKAWACSPGMNFNSSLQPKLQALHDHLTNDLKVDKLALVGFCWGYWCVAKFCGIPSLAVNVVATCGPHPSVHLEDAFFGGSSASVMEKVNVPSLLLPTSNDPNSYRTDGDMLNALKSNGNEVSTFTDYPAVVHGFLARGDDTDPVVKENIQKAQQEIADWIKKYF